MRQLLRVVMIISIAWACGTAIARGEPLKVLTINAWSGLDYNGTLKMGEYESRKAREARFSSLVAQARQLSPDVIFVQEANPVGKYTSRLASSLSMNEIHQVVNAGFKVGSLGIPFNLKIAHLGRDSQILQLARDTAELIIMEDPDLKLEKNFIFSKHIKKGNPQRIDWGKIS